MKNNTVIDYNLLPDHVAIIMDGNGRWAKQRGLPRLSGHDAGARALKRVTIRAASMGLKYLTVYAFSTENWKRPAEEVNGIFRLLSLYVDKELKALVEKNTKLCILGDYTKLPDFAVKSVKKAIDATSSNTGLQLNIALNYGSRAEITDAVKEICSEAVAGKLDPGSITEETINSHLYTKGLPDPDLLIRTSGEMRISNYLLWQLAYSEFIFTDVFWPDFTGDYFEECIADFQGRNRRYGGL